MNYHLIEALERLTDRYLNSDALGALAAVNETEQLLRKQGSSSPIWRFPLALTLANRSEILLQLGDEAQAASVLEEAVLLFRETTTGVQAGLVTGEAVQRFARAQDATSKVKWRRS